MFIVLWPSHPYHKALSYCAWEKPRGQDELHELVAWQSTVIRASVELGERERDLHIQLTGPDPSHSANSSVLFSHLLSSVKPGTKHPCAFGTSNKMQSPQEIHVDLVKSYITRGFLFSLGFSHIRNINETNNPPPSWLKLAKLYLTISLACQKLCPHHQEPLPHT